MSIPVHNQSQRYNGKYYSVSTLIEISKNIPVELVDIRLINKYHILTNIENNDYDLADFADTMKSVMNADLKYPILLYRGFILDGKHRLTKAIFLGKKKIKVKILKELPINTN